jgi:hypothetical protein
MIDTNESQEDRYYRLRREVEIATGIQLGAEVFNKLFFTVLEGPYTRCRELEKELNELKSAIKVIANAVNNDA